MVDIVPNVVFKTRVQDDDCTDCPNPYRWEDKSTDDFFSGKKVVLFSLPGAFTPTCSTYQLPNFEKKFAEFSLEGIDEIYCMSVNDAFVMNAWAKDQKLEYVKVIPDGSGRFTRGMGMLVRKDPEDFGYRSWRYAAHIEDCVVKKMWVEEGKMDDCPTDPYGATNPQEILEDLQNVVK